MDFIVSKVAMSVCALLVVTVLSECFNPMTFIDERNELDDIARDLCELIDWAVMSGSEVSIDWRVPYLAGGSAVLVRVQDGIVSAEAGDARCLARPASSIHTWTCSCTSMNSSGLELLDKRAEAAKALSGGLIKLSTELVVLDGQPTMLAFVHS